MAPMLPIMERMVRQQRGDKRKVYSLPEPAVSCIAKGKAHKQDALGSKVSVASWSGGPVVVGITSFVGHPHDGKNLSDCFRSSSAVDRSAVSAGVGRPRQSWSWSSGRCSGDDTRQGGPC
jgi:transposase, IS5 family